MCSCEEEFARRFLPHQISYTKKISSHERIPITLGFRRAICHACRGVREPACPKSDRPGSSSKIRRYYWREIAFATIRRFAEWAQAQGYGDWLKASRAHREAYDSIHRHVIEEIKELHESAPKYTYEDEPSSEVLARNHVEVVNLYPSRVMRSGETLFCVDGECTSSANDVAARHFRSQGYSSLFTESRPFHVLFGTFMWPIIQEPNDPKVRRVGISRKLPSGERRNLGLVWTLIPDDFGTADYAERRAAPLRAHLAKLEGASAKLLEIFDHWLEPSYELRSYLSAHRQTDVVTARSLISILPSDALVRILGFLTQSYWRRYCGWPDMILHSPTDFFFAEVKFSGHGLTEDQKQWIHGNTAELHLPFKLVKLHKTEITV